MAGSRNIMICGVGIAIRRRGSVALLVAVCCALLSLRLRRRVSGTRRLLYPVALLPQTAGRRGLTGHDFSPDAMPTLSCTACTVLPAQLHVLSYTSQTDITVTTGATLHCLLSL